MQPLSLAQIPGCLGRTDHSLAWLLTLLVGLQVFLLLSGGGVGATTKSAAATGPPYDDAIQKGEGQSSEKREKPALSAAELDRRMMPVASRRRINRQTGIMKRAYNPDWPHARLIVRLMSIKNLYYCGVLIAFGGWKDLAPSKFPRYCCAIDMFRVVTPCHDGSLRSTTTTRRPKWPKWSSKKPATTSTTMTPEETTTTARRQDDRPELLLM